MTDTDTDIDIDPEFAAHLRRTMRAVAASVESAADADLSNVVRLVTAPPPPGGRKHRWAWLGAAAVTGLVAGAGLMAVADRSPDDAAVPVASTVPEFVVGPDLGALARECGRLTHEMRAGMPDEFLATDEPAPDPATAVVLLFDTEARPPHQRLVVIGDTSFIMCEISESFAAQKSDINVYAIPAMAAPLDGDVQVAAQSWYAGASFETGPGWVYAIGRVGPQVDGLEIELPDGTIIDGEVQQGWFVVEGPIPSGVQAFEERLNWTTATGDERTSRVDLLDPPSEAEACAAAPGCVVTKISQLREQAEYFGLDEQAEVLADLDVTPDERDLTMERYAECVNASDSGVTIRVLSDGAMEVGGSALDSSSPGNAAAENAQILCGAAHLDLVEEAREFLDAQRRVAEG